MEKGAAPSSKIRAKIRKERWCPYKRINGLYQKKCSKKNSFLICSWNSFDSAGLSLLNVLIPGKWSLFVSISGVSQQSLIWVCNFSSRNNEKHIPCKDVNIFRLLILSYPYPWILQYIYIYIYLNLKHLFSYEQGNNLFLHAVSIHLLLIKLLNK